MKDLQNMKNTIKCKNNYGAEVEVPIDKFFFRPSVYGFIVEKGKILVMNNKSNNKLWFPGGGLEIGEKLEEGLRRETKEETGLDIIIDKLILTKENFFYYQPLDEAYHAFLFFYLCRPTTQNLIADDKVNDLESKKPRWVPLKSVKADDISDLSDEIYSSLQNLTI